MTQPRDAHPVAKLETHLRAAAGDRGADPYDAPDDLVAWDYCETMGWQVTLGDVKVGSAHAAR
jgi:hypothetical protein